MTTRYNEILNSNSEWVEGEPSEEGQRYRTVIDFGNNKKAYIGGVFTTIQGKVNKRITPKAFLSRFTTAEYVGIDLASIDNPQGTQQVRELAAMLRLYLMKINSAKFIDLGDTETIDGINALVQMGFLTSVRAYEILNNPVDDKEKV